MSATRLAGVALAGLLLLVASAGMASRAASNKVPSTALDTLRDTIDANDLRPPECAGSVLAGIVTGSGGITDGNASSLILGSAGFDNIDAGGGNDCVVAGDGLLDIVNGRNGDDTLLGGPGLDIIDGGPNTDACYGGANNDFISNCELSVP